MRSYVALRPIPEMKLRRWIVALLGVALLLTCAPVLAQAPADHGRPLKVMTRNLYQGTDFTEAFGLTDITQLPDKATTIYSNVLASKPATRVAAVAQEIADNTPDLVGVQEVTRWVVTVPGVGVVQTIDPVELLLADLQSLGEPYVKVKVQPQFDFTAPSAYGYVTTTTQIAILARAETLESQMQITGSDGNVFQTNLPLGLPAPVGEIPIYRGWAYADVVYRGKAVRFVTAHPEAFYDAIENAQVYELLTGIANTTLAGSPVIMAADFNTNALDSTLPPSRDGYDLIRQFGFTDAWAATEKTVGFTCCQSTLTTPNAEFSQRIDFVFLSAGLTPFNAKLTGNKPDSRIDGLWPSDHAGLVARIWVGE